jgi:hypothetical protein
MQADKRDKSLAQNEPGGQSERGQNEPGDQFDPAQNDLLTDNEVRTIKKNKRTNHACKKLDCTDLENSAQELDAGMGIISDDDPALASSGVRAEHAQPALRPNRAPSRSENSERRVHSTEVGLQKSVYDILACQQEQDVAFSSPPAELFDVSDISPSSGSWEDNMIADDAEEEDTLDGSTETRTSVEFDVRPDREAEHESKFTAAQLPMPAPASSGPDQQGPTSTPNPEAKPKIKYAIQEGPECWFIVEMDKGNKTVGRAPTMEQASVTLLQTNGTPHDRFLASKSDNFCKVFDTSGGFARVVKTCPTIGQAREEAARLSKESLEL